MMQPFFQKKAKTPSPEHGPPPNLPTEHKASLCSTSSLPAELQSSQASQSSRSTGVAVDELPPLLAPIASICEVTLSSLDSGQTLALYSEILPGENFESELEVWKSMVRHRFCSIDL